MRKFLGVAVAAAAAFGLSSAASAATVSAVDFSLPTPAGPVQAASSTTGSVSENVTDSVSGERLSPWDGTAEDGAFYTSVSADSSATYEFGGVQTILNILWGSVDTYNDIDFLLGGVVVDTINGQALIDAGATAASGFVIATIAANAFDAIVLRSTGQNAFEFAELSAEVPLPGAAALLISGLGGLAFASRRKRKALAA